MRRPSKARLRFVIALCLLAGCERKEPLTAEKAEQLIRNRQFAREPVYAEVPQKVWWSAESPKDAYDERALRTMRNLQRAGFITVKESSEDGKTTYIGTPTAKGFPVLGTVPSARGPAFRAQICEKVYDGLRNFKRHPAEPTVGHGDLIWHYTNPTPMYDLFETKMNKPLDKPFASYVAFHYADHQWKFEVTVRKTDGTERPGS